LWGYFGQKIDPNFRTFPIASLTWSVKRICRPGQGCCGRAVMIAGTSRHSDAETLLLEQGSKQADLWGINLYLKKSRDEWIEYDSMINLRPWQDNDSRGVDDLAIRQKIREIVDQLVKES